VKVGQQVQIRIDSFPDRSFRGSIEQINSQGEFTPRNIQSRDERNHQVFGVKIHIEDSSGVIKSGMAAEVTIGQDAPMVSSGPSPSSHTGNGSAQTPFTRSTLATRLN
jgi:multidrug resistance efflux pump